MRLEKLLISQTIQIRQFEPLNIQVEFVFDEADALVPPQEKVAQATRFVANSLRAEYNRLNMNKATPEEKEKYEAFNALHAEAKYFG